MAQTTESEKEKASKRSEGGVGGRSRRSTNSDDVEPSRRVLSEQEDDIPIYRIDLDLPPQERYVWLFS